MGYVVESAFVTDLLDGQRRVAEQMTGHWKAVLVEIGDDGFARMMLEEGAEWRAVHAYMLGKVINGDVADYNMSVLRQKGNPRLSEIPWKQEDNYFL